MAGVFRLQSNSVIKRLIQPILLNSRAISTSKKNSDTATVCEPAPTTACETKPDKKNWASYGFDFENETADRNATHSIFFMSVTVCIIFGGFIWSYLPDYQMRDWSQREAYLEVRRREKAGLPLLDPNLVDPSTIVLPDDEELGDTEIII